MPSSSIYIPTLLIYLMQALPTYKLQMQYKCIQSNISIPAATSWHYGLDDEETNALRAEGVAIKVKGDVLKME